MATTRPQYVPTSDEMKDAVSVALKDVSQWKVIYVTCSMRWQAVCILLRDGKVKCFRLYQFYRRNLRAGRNCQVSPHHAEHESQLAYSLSLDRQRQHRPTRTTQPPRSFKRL